MCILFFNARADPQPDEYALILINNRDEVYSRPTLVSNFWKEDATVLSGRDAMTGKEGGTWLGISKKGKIGVLLNMLQPVAEEDSLAKGRGSLVSNFITGNTTSKDYFSSIMKERELYNGFNLITIETQKPFPSFNIGHYNNLSGDCPVFLSQGIHGMGNCPQNTPWRKITYGRQKFSEICEKFPKLENKDELVDSLIDLLSDDTRHFPDTQLQSQGKGKEHILPHLSALNVKVPEIGYGTRTNTIILIDKFGNVDYVERTMVEPVDRFNPQWARINHRFTLDLA